MFTKKERKKGLLIDFLCAYSKREKAAANQPPNSTKLDLTVIQEETSLEDIPEYSDYEEEEEEEVEFVEVISNEYSSLIHGIGS